MGDIAALQVFDEQLSAAVRAKVSDVLVQRYLGKENGKKTAQSVMLKSSTPERVVMQQGETWMFDSNAALNLDPSVCSVYYKTQWDGLPPAIECLNYLTYEPCDGTEAPPAPEVFPPNIAYAAHMIAADQCILFEGGTLTTRGTYGQGIWDDYSQYGYAYFYIWTYTVEPAGTGVVPPRSAWVRTAAGNDGNTVPVAIKAELASESVVHSTAAGSSNWNRPYDFGLLDNNNKSRVKDLKVTLTGTDAANHVVGPISKPASHTVQSNVSDFLYTASTESGNTNLLAARSILSDYFNAPSSAYVSDILNGRVNGFDGIADNYAGNDSNAYFAANVHKAVMTPVIFNLGPGCYKASITGVMKKGNVVDSLDLNIRATKTVGISAGTCSTPVVTGGCP